jgi:DNA-binding GntR family transcriptional regulator
MALEAKGCSVAILKDVPKLQTQPIREVVYEHLRKAIVSGELAADTSFTDQEVADEFGISRTPVREAVQKLESAGYIERVPMRGNRVRGLSPLELAYSFSVRKAIETLAVRYAALNIAEADLERLASLISKAEAFLAESRGDEGLAEYYAILKSFNEIVFKASGSPHLAELIWAQRELFDRYRVMRDVVSRRPHKSLERRRGLYAALRARDPEAASAIWAENLAESFATWREVSGYAKELEPFRFL